MKKITIRMLFRMVLVAFAVYALFNVVTLRATLEEKNAEYQRLEEEINSQTLDNEAMQESLNKELTPDEIASIARNKLGYSLPGERIFIDITGK